MERKQNEQFVYDLFQGQLGLFPKPIRFWHATGKGIQQGLITADRLQ